MTAFTHSLHTAVAEDVGPIAAIVFYHMAFWIQHAEDNNEKYIDGRHWVYNSAEAWAKQFTYLSAKQIRTAIEKLEEAGYLVSGNHHTDPRNRSKWYAFGDQDRSKWSRGHLPKSDDCIFPNGEIDFPAEENVYRTDLSTTDISTSNPPIVPQGDECPYDEILSLQKEILPNIRGARILTDKRKQKIRKMWKKKDGLNTLKHWENYFRDLANYDYWQGRVPSMIPDFDLLIREDTIVKAYEGYYADKQKEFRMRNGGTHYVR